jgi:CRISPR/Cas system-associated exonuclease Cas4 (RecB family)
MSTFECSCELRAVKDAFLNWREHVAKRANLKVEESEVAIFSSKYGYAGTMDALVTMLKAGTGRGASQERCLVVLDWKTSNYMRVEYAWQVAAYVRAYEEMTGQKIEDAFLVRLEKESGDFEVRRIRDIESAFQGFLACLAVYNAVNGPNSYFT